VLVCFAGTALVLIPVTKATLHVPELDVLLSEEVIVVVVIATSEPKASPVVASLPASFVVIVIIVVPAEAVFPLSRVPKTGSVAATAGHVPMLATLIVASGM
jgi:hypothetical protein